MDNYDTSLSQARRYGRARVSAFLLGRIIGEADPVTTLKIEEIVRGFIEADLADFYEGVLDVSEADSIDFKDGVNDAIETLRRTLKAH